MPECDYCGADQLAYEMRSGKGMVTRCIPCLAIEQGQQQINLPFEEFVDFESDGIVYDSEEDKRESRENSFEVCRSWWRVLARFQQDEPLVIKDPDEFDVVLHEWTREFLTNVMGEDAHLSPSDVAETGGNHQLAQFGGNSGGGE